MKSKMMLWLMSVSVVALAGCVEIKSNASVSADAQVKFTTTYDVSRVISAMQMSNQGSAEDIAKGLSCEKMNEQLTKEYSCKDLGLGKFAVSGEYTGNISNGVTIDDKKQLSIDAVQFFRKVADISPKKQPEGALDPASVMMSKGLVPVGLDSVAQYKQMGMNFELALTLPAEVLTIDGAPAQDVKNNTVVVNFIEIAGKDAYVITSKTGKNGIWGKLLFVLLSIALIFAAVLYLLKRKKAQNKTPPAPITQETVETKPEESV